jgi:hypothetical protein
MRGIRTNGFLYYEWVRKSLLHRWLFRRIEKNWSIYWDEIYRATLVTMSRYKRPNCFGMKPFEIRMNKSGRWIDDDMMFELHFFNPNGEYEFPIWLVAFKKLDVVHSQASF